MERGAWVTKAGNSGEMPVKILADTEAEFVVGFADGARIGSFNPPPGTTLVLGDVCIIKAEVVTVDTDTNPVSITVDISEIDEFVHKTERQERSDIEEMMAHLEVAKQHHQEERSDSSCENCNPIDSETTLSIETAVGDRDLHYCTRCDRLISTREYKYWKRVHR